MALTASVGEVKIPEDKDFQNFKSICENNDDWIVAVNKNQTSVWTKANELSNFKMVKVREVNLQWTYLL